MGRVGRIVAASLILVGALAAAGGYVAVQYASSFIAARLQAETGYRWTVSGTPGIALSPAFAIVVRNAFARVVLDAEAEASVRADTIRVSGSPWDVLRGGRATAIEVESPVIRAPAEYWRHIDVADAMRGAARSGRARTGGLPERIAAKNGRIEFVDASGRVGGELDDISFETARAGTTQEVTFGLRLRGAGLNGDMTLGDPSPNGAVPIRFGISLPGILPGRISGAVESSSESGRITLSRLTGAVGPDRFQGAALVDLNGKPTVRLDLGFKSLTIPLPAKGAEPAWALGPDDLALLNGFDGHLSAYVGSLRVGSVSLSECTAEAEIEDGALKAALPQAGLYGGQATAKLTLASQAGMLHHSVQAQVQEVRTLPLLTDMAGLTIVDGAARLTVDVQGAARTSNDLVSGLSGTASLALRDGRLNTVDLPGVAQLVVSQLPSYSSRTDAGTTAFDDVSATFKIENGKAATDDFTLNGPVVVATGAGSIDLAARTLAFRVEPRLVNLKGAANPLGALRVPVLVEGPLSSPRVRPDFAAASASPVTDGGGAFAPLGGGMNLDRLLDAILPPSTGLRPGPPVPDGRRPPP